MPKSKIFFPAGRWPAWLDQLVWRVWVVVVGRFWVGFPENGGRPPTRQNPPNSRPLPDDQLVSRSGPEMDRRWARPFSKKVPPTIPSISSPLESYMLGV